jgi:DNA replication and repair protein RecF
MFLDIYLSQFRKLYLDDLTQYRKALSQRNAALKHGHDPSPFGTILAEIGARVILGRIQFLRELTVSTSRFYSNISRSGSLVLRYEPSVPCDDDTDDLKLITERFLEKLDQVRIREQAVQTTLVGPHRDEIVFSIDNRPARSHGSQGEWRTAAIALKLAVYQILREKRRMPPILLLDEIFAELDQHRVGGLIECFGQFGQLFLTTAVEPPAALSSDGRSFRIGENRIEGSQ